MDTAGHYRILDRIGAGGMGVVFKAEDTRLRRTVALKFLPPSMAGDERAVARLTREARTASSLNHPNICTIYDIGDDKGRPFIAMEYLDGQPLATTIGSRPLDVEKLIDYGIQIADALDAAHAHGIIHRDIKPANIFITKRDHVKVLDFGIARPAPESPSAGDPTVAPDAATLLMTQPGTVTGTLAYMSPEQALSKPVDARSDLFSLGLVLFEMATGRQAFDGRTPAVVYDAILNRQPPPARDLNAALPRGFDDIVARAIEKNPDLRYQTASDLRADLLRLKRNLETQQVPSEALGGGASPAQAAPAGRPKRIWFSAGIGAFRVWIAAGVGIMVMAIGSSLLLKQAAPPAPPTDSPAPSPSVDGSGPPVRSAPGAVTRGPVPRPEPSQEVKAARAKLASGDAAGAIADMRKITDAPHTVAPLEAYGTILEAENRRANRAGVVSTLDDLATRYPSDPRVPIFLVATARLAMQSARPGRVPYVRELAKKVADAYPTSPAAAEARKMLQQIDAARGRGRQS